MLDEHPWAVALISSQRQHNNTQQPGEQLISFLTDQFNKMLPSSMPRRGKRLDIRWGVFGILAAHYFAPLQLGIPFPAGVRESWDRLDESILLFVHNRTNDLTEGDRALYRFAGNELAPVPTSTLSGWQNKGLQQLAEIMDHEIRSRGLQNIVIANIWKPLKFAAIVTGIIFLSVALFLGLKAWNFYQRSLAIEQKVDELIVYLNPSPKFTQVPAVAVRVEELRAEIDSLQNDAKPYFPLTLYLAWVPKYGGTVSQAENLLSFAQNLAIAADEGLTAISPAIEESINSDQPLEVLDLVLHLQEASPQLLNAQIALAQAQAARDRIDVKRLTPKINKIVVAHIDPLFHSLTGSISMEDALSMIQIAPGILGSDKAGPQTYLILMQNEDELRPTGGFLTAVGSAVIKDGKLISIEINSSDIIDDLSKPYPIPPWQFKEFMNIEMLLFRDSNWFTDFPTTASWAEYLYSYSRASSADGLIALDMHVVTRLLETVGPVRVDSVDYPISSNNVTEYLRSAEESRPKGVKGKWDRKQFIGELAKPLLEKILNARGQTWAKLIPELKELLDERHILLQFDDEEATAILQRREWDGAVRVPPDSDYLMFVEANMGYNKSNAVIETGLAYTVDLTNPAVPSGSLIIDQTNHSKVVTSCVPYQASEFYTLPSTPGEIREPIYIMDYCHWGYLRIYTPAGTKLVHSNPSEIPAEATMLGEMIPARTDDLDNEGIPGAQVFGILAVTPTQQTTKTEFGYLLPANVLSKDEQNGLWTYHIKVQKQPGTLADAFSLTLQLPDGARIETATVPFEEVGGAWNAKMDLLRDLLISVSYGLE